MITKIEYTRGTHPAIVVRGRASAEYVEDHVRDAFLQAYQRLCPVDRKPTADSTEREIEEEDSISRDSLLGAYSDPLFWLYRTTPNVLDRWVRRIRSEVVLGRGIADFNTARACLDDVVDTLRRDNPDASFQQF